MKLALKLSPWLICGGLFCVMPTTRAADGRFEDALARATLDYTKRLELANAELTQLRAQIAEEKVPLLKVRRAAEDRIIAAQTAISKLEATQAQAEDRRKKLLRAAEDLHRNVSYVGTLAQDGLKGIAEGANPGEAQWQGPAIDTLQQKFVAHGGTQDPQDSVAVAEFALLQLQRSLGGYLAKGTALRTGDNTVETGTFAFIGPETFFQPSKGGGAGTVRLREGSPQPTFFPLAEWKSEAAVALFQGQKAEFPADATAGKALRLQQTKGSFAEHVRKGGVIAYLILGVGAVAAVMAGLKIRDVMRMGIDSPERIRAVLEMIARGDRAGAEAAIGRLRRTSRELFAAGLRHSAQPKEILEEHLYAVLLRQRLHYERRLPLLAVIATAAPLMGLLGTVTGMVKTFALITVFGTGNAGKLASGISEVLVATELGLAVAIPALVAHGFLAHRIQRNLSLLERYAVEFVTAVQTNRSGVPVEGSMRA
jgi:biopolymer transport protein ExbB